MNVFLRRVRGIVGMALTWSVGWAIAGTVLALLNRHVATRTGVGTPVSVLTLAAIWGALGFATGGVFGLILRFAEYRKVVDSLEGFRMAAWGAVAGSVLPAVYTIATGNPGADIVVGAALGAASAIGSLWIARSAPQGSTESVRAFEMRSFPMQKVHAEPMKPPASDRSPRI